MKKLSYSILLILLTQFTAGKINAQAEKNALSLSISYYNNNNQVQYLVAHAKSRIDGKFQMIPDVPVSFYIRAEAPANLLGKAVTNEKGDAILMMPPTAKEEWKKASKVSFFVSADASKQFDEAKGSQDIIKSKIKIDTLADKKITATLMELKDTVWTPVKGVDVRIGVKRLDADLNVSETLTYSTDSLGVAAADFKRDSLPGDSKGNLILVARVDDNDLYGNLSSEIKVQWGAAQKYYTEFDKRTLFARRGRSPLWLELMAYSIVVAVWGILIYLVGQIRKLKQLGA